MAILILIRFVWSMISYGSGLPGASFTHINLRKSPWAFVARFFLDIGFISQEQMLLFIVLGMAGFFGSDFPKAPLTAIILVTEMVGSLNQLMVIGLVALSSYVMMDLLGGAPVYEAMLEKFCQKK